MIIFHHQFWLYFQEWASPCTSILNESQCSVMRASDSGLLHCNILFSCCTSLSILSWSSFLLVHKLVIKIWWWEISFHTIEYKSFASIFIRITNSFSLLKLNFNDLNREKEQQWSLALHINFRFLDGWKK